MAGPPPRWGKGVSSSLMKVAPGEVENREDGLAETEVTSRRQSSSRKTIQEGMANPKGSWKKINGSAEAQARVPCSFPGGGSGKGAK